MPFSVLADPLIDASQLSTLVRDIGIPPRPQLLERLHDELTRDEPRLDMLVQLASYDVAIAAALLKVANARGPGTRSGAGTLRRAFEQLGSKRCISILSALVLRKVFPVQGPTFERFWDVAHRRSLAMAWLARQLGVVEADQAHTFGLFCDVGIPVLLQRFLTPSYRVTLAEANLGHKPFTEVERSRHATDHAAVGAALAQSWGVSDEIVEAVAWHHDYRVFTQPGRTRVAHLVALALVADRYIQRRQGRNRHGEWQRGGAQALLALGATEAAFDIWCDELESQLELMA
ncbi:HDOD domain-containing protein [Leptothrix discophora]|uniref:HDOD domain-containing protein n=1 Tax=Leptothrix discophora TaxID=89 RepID=A0ABT9FYX7_LEPDI|nr:HDOD domain-containing protein [Leptothrix discophora]MDP4299425.1 HDOD domain-containing protein [Leptothrix discophora]